MKKFFQKLEAWEITIAAVFIVTSCTLIFASAITRSFGKPINWFQDISLLLFAWAVFLGADAALRNNRLVRVELFTSRVNEKTARMLQLGCHVIISVFLIAMVFYGFVLCRKTSSRVFPGLSWLSYTWVTASFPIGSVLMLSTALMKIKDDIFALRAKGDK